MDTVDHPISEADSNPSDPAPSNPGPEIPPQNDDKPEQRRIKFNPEAMDYDMTGEKIMVIFNHYTYRRSGCFGFYRPPPSRKGTEKDVLRLKKTFGDLGFKVIVYVDLTHDKILETAAQISSQDHSNTSCLAVAILTHGDKGGKLMAYDRFYFLKDITSRFQYGDKGLLNKPKLFFIQACRGNRVDDGRSVELDGTDDNTLVIPTFLDFFYLYSTVDDHISWRDREGSWLIQELCDVISEHPDKELQLLATLTIRRVAYQYNSFEPDVAEYHNKKQTPEVRHTLTKRLLLK